MGIYEICAHQVGRLRFQVDACIDVGSPFKPDFSIRAGKLSIQSPRPYRIGVIINPDKILRRLIAARRAA
jgi:hypothetical protein